MTDDFSLRLSELTILSFIQHEASLPLVAALVNANARVLIKSVSFNNIRLNGSFIAKIIHKQGLSFKLFDQLSVYFSETQVRRSFRFLSLCDQHGINQEEAEKFLTILSETPSFSFDLHYLELTIHSNQFALTYFFALKHRSLIKSLLLTAPIAERKQFWLALSESLTDGHFLEVKFWLLK